MELKRGVVSVPLPAVHRRKRLNGYLRRALGKPSSAKQVHSQGRSHRRPARCLCVVTSRPRASRVMGLIIKLKQISVPALLPRIVGPRPGKTGNGTTLEKFLGRISI